MSQNADGTVRWFAKSLVRGSVAVLPMFIALYTVAFFDAAPFWWFAAGMFATIATKDYVGSMTDSGGDSVQ